MSKHTEGFTKNIASSRNWFRSELLPDDIKLQCQLLERNTTIQYYDGIKLFYVEDGEGSLIVNGKTYSLHPGSCCLLYCFHFHRICPDRRSTLKIQTCCFSYNTFLFACIIPGYPLTEIEHSKSPVLVDFSAAQQLRIRQILSAMEECQSSPDDALQHSLLFEWLGRLCRAYSNAQTFAPAATDR